MNIFLEALLGKKPPALDAKDPLFTICQCVRGNPEPIDEGYAFPVRDYPPEFLAFVKTHVAQNAAFTPDPDGRTGIRMLEITGNAAILLRDRLTQYRVQQPHAHKSTPHKEAMVSWKDFAGNGNKVRQNDPESIYSRVVEGSLQYHPTGNTLTVVLDLSGVEHWIGESIDRAFPDAQVITENSDVGPTRPKSLVKLKLNGADYIKFNEGYTAHVIAEATAIKKAPSR